MIIKHINIYNVQNMHTSIYFILQYLIIHECCLNNYNFNLTL